MSVAPFHLVSATRVLLIEDADADAHVVESVLDEFSFGVRRVSRLSDALAALRSEEFDAVLADLGLPDSVGLSTLEELRQRAPAIPIVVMTGRGDESTAVRAVAAGAQDYLVKGSTDANTLVRAIRHAIEHGRAHEEISVSEALTERRRAEEERNASEARLHQAQQALDALRRRYEVILNSITDGVHGVDLAGNIVFENPAAAAMLGWPAGALIGRSAHQIIRPTRADGSPRSESECPIHWTLADGRTRFSDQDVFCRRDGKEIRVEFTTASMLDEHGRIAGVVVTFRDVSRQKQMEQQIERAARVESLGRVSASVAHEFNNVLMGMKPFAEVLRRRMEEDATLEKPVRHVLNAVRRGERLTDEILRFTNPAEPRIQQVDLAALLRDFSDEARGILADRRMEMELPETLVVRADADQISQVLLNLVMNARNATRTDDVVTLGAAPASSLAFLREQLSSPERFAGLYVRDTGGGISPEVKGRLFEPFFTTRKTGGTGLGLAVAYRIASAHGGQIVVDSEIGRGAAFYVVLPAS